MNRSKWIPILFLLTRVTPLTAQEINISGEVLDERLRPIYGAVVSVNLTPGPGEKAKPLAITMKSGPEGGFLVKIPPGAYQICAFLPNSELLNSCLWFPAESRVVVSAAEKASSRRIVLRRGFPFEVFLDDEQKLMTNSAAKKSAPVLVALTGGGGQFVPFVMRNGAPNQQVYRALVPRDVDLTVSVSSPGFKLSDEKGTPLNAVKGRNIPIKYSGNEAERKLKLQVTDKEAESK